MIAWIGNKLNALGVEAFKLRCKLCGCSCGVKGKAGSALKRIGSGITGCPEHGPDNYNNWQRGTPLKIKELAT